jgi:dihydrofolate reductase
MICSIGKNRELGKKNGLIWHFKDDMKFFKDTTMNHKAIMGLNTYKSLPGDLPGRHIIVISFDPVDGVDTVNGIEPIVEKYKDSQEEIFICGGASIYRQFLPYASKMYLTEIDASDSEADTFFPEFDEAEWKKTLLEEHNQKDIDFKMFLYERII